MSQSETDFKIGEDLYGVSIAELEARLDMLAGESARIAKEIAKKQAEKEAADSLFGKKPG